MPNPISDPLVEVPDTDATTGLVNMEATVEGVATVTLNRPSRKNAFDASAIMSRRAVVETTPTKALNAARFRCVGRTKV